MSRERATAVLVLWSSRQFSTADIAGLLGLQEAAVSRLIIAARSIVLDQAEAAGRVAAQ